MFFSNHNKSQKNNFNIRENRMRNLVLIYFLVILSLTAFKQAQTQTLQNNLWIPDGEVIAVATSGNTVYIGGGFSNVGPLTGPGTTVNINTGKADMDLPKVSGTINAVVSDGSGGWYIGGTFWLVGGVSRNQLAHILPDKTLDPNWNPNAGASPVNTIAVSGSTVYVGGDFITMGGLSRNRIAAIDAATGAVLSWNPNVNGTVNTIVVSGSTVYVGGDFTALGDSVRNRIAAIDASTGTVLSWNPNADGVVRTISVSNSTVYAGGRFTNIGSEFRNYIAELDASTGNATSWNPNANYYIETIVFSDSSVYAGGRFTNIGGETRNYIAEIDTATGNATSWNPNANGNVLTLAVSGSSLYTAGEFTNIGGTDRNYIAALEKTTGHPTVWNPNANGYVYAFDISGSSLFTGGNFNSIGRVVRKNIAAIDVVTGEATDWDPKTAGYVYSLAVSGSTVYVGGGFTHIGDSARNNLAALNAETGKATNWNPSTNGNVFAIAVLDTNVFAAGYFSALGEIAVDIRIAAIDITTGLSRNWNVDALNDIGTSAGTAVLALAVADSTLYFGGKFERLGLIDKTPRKNIAAINAYTGKVKEWNPSANDIVHAIEISGSTLYAGGNFTNIAGTNRNYIAALDVASGNAKIWDPNANAPVLALAISGVSVYAGGYFTSIGGYTRNYLAEIDASIGLPTIWNPDANDRVNSIALNTNNAMVYAGGRFSTMSGKLNFFFSGINNPGDPTLPITLASFSANLLQNNKTVELNWMTINEINNYGFFVERRAENESQFMEIPESFVEGHGTTYEPHEYNYNDNTINTPGIYYYRLRQVDNDGLTHYSNPVMINLSTLFSSDETPIEFTLKQNYPNPFNPSTTIEFSLPNKSNVNLKVYDVLGSEIATLVSRELQAGNHIVRWDAKAVANGLYFYRLEAGTFTQVKKLMILK